VEQASFEPGRPQELEPGRPYLSLRLLPFVSVTHYNMDYYSLTDHGDGGMEG